MRVQKIFAAPAIAMQVRGMKLSPREVDHLNLSAAGSLAQRRLARGVRLNHPEAVALLSSQMMERIRDGMSVGELMSLGKRLLGWRQVLPGVPKLISNVQIEVCLCLPPPLILPCKARTPSNDEHAHSSFYTEPAQQT